MTSNLSLSRAKLKKRNSKQRSHLPNKTAANHSGKPSVWGKSLLAPEALESTGTHEHRAGLVCEQSLNGELRKLCSSEFTKQSIAGCRIPGWLQLDEKGLLTPHELQQCRTVSNHIVSRALSRLAVNASSNETYFWFFKIPMP